jgi:hypothetical protein
MELCTLVVKSVLLQAQQMPAAMYPALEVMCTSVVAQAWVQVQQDQW